MVRAMVGIPNKKWLTLTEAITYLAWGKAYTKEMFWDRLEQAQEQRLELWRKCSDESRADPALSHWPSRYPGDAPRTVEAINVIPNPWPPSACELMNLAEEQIASDQSDLQKLEQAEESLHGGIADGKVELKGKKPRNRRIGPVEPIDCLYFSERRTLSVGYDEIYPRMGKEPDLSEWSDVRVDCASFRNWLRMSDGPNNASYITAKRPATEATQEAIRAIWPTGIPPHLRSGERDQRIIDWCKEQVPPIFPPSPRVIRRVVEPS